jgi:hypothetical protein
MPCQPFALSDGTSGIVCSRTRRQRCKCGRAATLLCDWKVPGPASSSAAVGGKGSASSSAAVGGKGSASSSAAAGIKNATCDAPICSHCTTSPAPGKDLCHDHAAQWHARQLHRAARATRPEPRSIV